MENRIEDIEEIDTLIAELEISKGKGNLILCVVNSPVYRDRIIQILRGRFTSKVIGVTKGKQIIDILKRKDFDGVHILMWNMPEEATEDLLNTLNNFRELFYEVNIPNIVFYNQGFSESIIRKAPDFWRYRGNYYEFNEIEWGLAFEALESLTTSLNFKDKKDLLRRKKINEYLLDKVKDKDEKSKILNELGIISHYLGELDRALVFFDRALELNTDLGIKDRIAVCYGNLGIVYGDKGELDKALEYHTKAVKLDDELGLKERVAIDLGNLGKIYRIKGEIDKALDYYKKALKLSEQLGQKELIATNSGNIGIVYANKGELDKALDYFNKALKLSEKLGQKELIATHFGHLGNVHMLNGEINKALEYYNKSIKLYEELGIKEGIAFQLGNIGLANQFVGELDKALEYNKKSLDIFKTIGNEPEIARTLTNIGEIFYLKGDKMRSLKYNLEAQNYSTGSYISEVISKRLKKLKHVA